MFSNTTTQECMCPHTLLLYTEMLNRLYIYTCIYTCPQTLLYTRLCLCPHTLLIYTEMLPARLPPLIETSYKITNNQCWAMSVSHAHRAPQSTHAPQSRRCSTEQTDTSAVWSTVHTNKVCKCSSAMWNEVCSVKHALWRRRTLAQAQRRSTAMLVGSDD